MTRFQIQTPDFSGAAEAAQLILTLLKQEAKDLVALKIDHTFFRVLADFEAQAAAAGMPQEDNPFRRMSDELVEWFDTHTLAGMQVPDVPEPFAEDIGRFRHMTQEAQHQPGMLVLAVRHLERVLPRIDPSVYPAFHAAVHNDLGTSYADLQVPDKQKALLRALECYEIALEYRTPEVTPQEYAATQYNRGNALLHMPALGTARDNNLRAAIESFEAALRILGLEERHHDGALINMALGLALALSPAETQTGNYARALRCFEQVFVDFSRAEYPPGWALAQVRLAEVHMFGGRLTKDAAECYRGALEIYTPAAAQFDNAAISVKLALILAVENPREAVNALGVVLPFLEQERSRQQHAQLVGSFGPAFAGEMTPEGRAQIAAEISRLEMVGGIELAQAHLRAVISDPVGAANHVKLAMEALHDIE